MSWEFIKKIGRTVSSSDLKRINEIMEKEAKEFKAFLTTNDIIIDEFIDHVLDAYAEGGLVAAS